MTDYSQNGEQKYILEALRDPAYPLSVADCIQPGRLLDIGAWNAKTFSNSRALIELGWKAVLFEPSPGPLRGLILEYGENPKVEVVGCAVTANGGDFLKMRVTDDALSVDATNEEHLKTWDDYGFYGTMTARAVSLAKVFDYWGSFDFVSIDVEGYSVDLFARMIQIGQRPRCVVVEHNSRWKELQAAAQFGDYAPMHPWNEIDDNMVLKWEGRSDD